MTAPWSTSGPLNRLVTLVTALTGIQHVYIGVPEKPANQVCAYITIGGQTVIEKTTGGQAQRTVGYRVVFVYALDGNESAAELIVADAIDAFMSALLADRTVGGTLERIMIDATEADRPQYALMSGEEFRQYPITIRGDQRNVYPVT